MCYHTMVLNTTSSLLITSPNTFGFIHLNTYLSQRCFIRFKAIVKKHFTLKIHTLYSDNGGEYLALANFFATNRISHLTTAPHTLEHNGYSERRERHIIEKGLSILSHASIPLNF